jgi:hypothetical protein
VQKLLAQSKVKWPRLNLNRIPPAELNKILQVCSLVGLIASIYLPSAPD